VPEESLVGDGIWRNLRRDVVLTVARSLSFESPSDVDSCTVSPLGAHCAVSAGVNGPARPSFTVVRRAFFSRRQPRGHAVVLWLYTANIFLERPSEKCLVMLRPRGTLARSLAGFKFPLRRRSHGAGVLFWAAGSYF
jgi:hypothetical protein